MSPNAVQALSAHAPEYRSGLAGPEVIKFGGVDSAGWARTKIVQSLAEQADAQKPEQFSVLRMLRAQGVGEPIPPVERVVCERTAERISQGFDRNRLWVPWGALAQRTMTTASGSKGGYIVGVETMEPADVMRGESDLDALGVQVVSDLRESVALPVVKSDASSESVAEGTAAASQTDPVFGQASGTPHTVIITIPISRQLAQQAGTGAETFLRRMLLANIGAKLFRLLLAGAGGVEPLGITNLPGINTVSGTSADHADLLSARRKCIDAGAVERNLRCVGPGAVQELLGAREKASGNGGFLWENSQVIGLPAIATKQAPASTLIVGDFSKARVLLWGPGIRIDQDPSQLWNSGGLVLRAMVFADVIYENPAAFSVVGSIT